MIVTYLNPSFSQNPCMFKNNISRPHCHCRECCYYPGGLSSLSFPRRPLIFPKPKVLLHRRWFNFQLWWLCCDKGFTHLPVHRNRVWRPSRPKYAFRSFVLSCTRSISQSFRAELILHSQFISLLHLTFSISFCSTLLIKNIFGTTTTWSPSNSHLQYIPKSPTQSIPRSVVNHGCLVLVDKGETSRHLFAARMATT